MDLTYNIVTLLAGSFFLFGKITNGKLFARFVFRFVGFYLVFISLLEILVHIGWIKI